VKSNINILASLLLIGLLAGCRTAQIYELPMYGKLPKSPEVQKADKEFVDWAVNEFGSPAKASVDAADRGWKSYYQNDMVTALNRFNQAWLLDTNNAQAYYGFGVIMGQRARQDNTEKNLQESIRFLQIASEKAPGNGRIIGDLAFSHTILGYYYKSEKKNIVEAQKHFEKAGELFIEAYKIEPTYPPIVGNWSVYYFYKDDYRQAKNKADEAIKLGYSYDPGYIKDLERNLK
jgi:tetratricopeptide (TPR) repeat protein